MFSFSGRCDDQTATLLPTTLRHSSPGSALASLDKTPAKVADHDAADNTAANALMEPVRISSNSSPTPGRPTHTSTEDDDRDAVAQTTLGDLLTEPHHEQRYRWSARVITDDRPERPGSGSMTTTFRAAATARRSRHWAIEEAPGTPPEVSCQMRVSCVDLAPPLPALFFNYNWLQLGAGRSVRSWMTIDELTCTA